MADKNFYIIQTDNQEQDNALKAFMEALKIKFEEAKEKPYDPEFVAKIEESSYGKGKPSKLTWMIYGQRSKLSSPGEGRY